jgi:hypothetical protein
VCRFHVTECGFTAPFCFHVTGCAVSGVVGVI